MTLPLVLKLAHVIVSILLVSGLIGRWLMLNKADRTDDIRTVRVLLDLASRYENYLVIPVSMLVLLFGLVTAWAQGQPILGFLQGSTVNWILVSLLLFLTIIPVIRFVFVPRGLEFGRALEEATGLGEVTPELRAAFRDPVVAAGHWYEMAVVVVVLVLMVTKPF